VAALSRKGEAGQSQLSLLTPRQREILQLVAEGNSTKQVAGRLGLSTKTIEAHRGAIMHRLGIRDLTGLVRFAIKEGLLSSGQ
jgi:DNA-binding NarL/FixJ family response regulator